MSQPTQPTKQSNNSNGSKRPVVPTSPFPEYMRKRDTVKPGGLATNGFKRFDHEVSLDNIKPQVNILRTKDSDKSTVGVAMGGMLAGQPVTAVLNDAASTMHAMDKRCNYKPHVKDIEPFKNGHKLLMGKIHKLDTIRTDGELLNKYFSKLNPGKVSRLVEAAASDEWVWDGEKKHVFAKNEALLKSDDEAKPRVVYQGTDMYNLVTGAVVDELSHRMMQELCLDNPLNTGNKVVYAVGMDKNLLWEKIVDAPGYAVESDMSNNDGSQSAEFRKYEAMFYKKLGAPDWFVREFAKNTRVRIWTRYGVQATVEGQRWSGEGTTTTGNSYVSMCVMLAAQQVARVEHSLNIHGGDDYLAVVDTENSSHADEYVKAIEETADKVGMKAKAIVPPTRSHATFYRKRGVQGTRGTFPVPQAGRVLAKLNVRPNLNTSIDDSEYMAGKLLCQAHEHKHVPVIRDILMHASSSLNENPTLVGLDKDLAKKGVVKIKREFEEAETLSYDEMDRFSIDVYDIPFASVVECYAEVVNSTLDYIGNWTRVGKKGRVRKEGYNPPLFDNVVYSQLIKLDLSG